ncbi:MAG: hypothetical protein UY71_C0011G0020 [Parcubacteria group bacterium GW2011_GWB1_52_7]|nr:MAG: hypothetical protein UY71_C0011G0020 [Parcubacteria group bacterium GW2011_GWB1_52_7]KKW30070.1 MAG: hypothetical protein UY75_C0044G0002 [Parcubacteria group bacterium GW2011_GWC2_52_8c]
MLASSLVVLAAAFLLTQAAVFATTIYLHRGLTHRAVSLRPGLEFMFRAALWLLTGQDRQQWVAVHRKHHAFTDREGDPHSPKLLGFWRVQLFNVFYYFREAKRPETVAKFAPDIPEDRWDRFLFSYGWAGPGIGAGLLVLCFGWQSGILIAILHAVLYVFVLAPLINGLGHWRGAQNFPNTAYNLPVLAWFTGGESLHNNHHAHPVSPKFSMAAGEFDPAWPIIRAFSRLGLLDAQGKLVLVD